MGFGGSSPCAQVVFLFLSTSGSSSDSRYPNIIFKKKHIFKKPVTEPWCPEICRETPKRGKKKEKRSYHISIYAQFEIILCVTFSTSWRELRIPRQVQRRQCLDQINTRDLSSWEVCNFIKIIQLNFPIAQ